MRVSVTRPRAPWFAKASGWSPSASAPRHRRRLPRRHRTGPAGSLAIPLLGRARKHVEHEVETYSLPHGHYNDRNHGHVLIGEPTDLSQTQRGKIAIDQTVSWLQQSNPDQCHHGYRQDEGREEREAEEPLCEPHPVDQHRKNKRDEHEWWGTEQGEQDRVP